MYRYRRRGSLMLHGVIQHRRPERNSPHSSSSFSNPCMMPIAFTRNGRISQSSKGVKLVTWRYRPRMTPSDCKPMRILACRVSRMSFSKARKVAGWERSSGALRGSVVHSPATTYTSSKTFAVSTKRRGKGSKLSALSRSFFSRRVSFSVISATTRQETHLGLASPEPQSYISFSASD